MERLVLKGGNALDIAYNISTRSSIDLDFSIDGEFSDFAWFETTITKVIVARFEEAGLRAFDVRVTEVPDSLTPNVRDFWGGYKIEFKLATEEIQLRFADDVEQMRRNATVIGPNQVRTFSIDISKFEHCSAKKPVDILDYRIWVYSPEAIVLEKLRAICQQMPEYGNIVTNPRRRPRARDFVDIYHVADALRLNLQTIECRRLLELIFQAKRVPTEWLMDIRNHRGFHASDFESVRLTVVNAASLKEYDEYFEYVVELAEMLHSLGKI
jgi:predicted nucleotidyltransferase component of viral defense system